MVGRANIAIKQLKRDEWVWLYTQHDGGILPILLQRALRRGKKVWKHPHLLAKVIFVEMVQERPFDIDGYGISTYPLAGAYPTLQVSCEKKLIAVAYPPSPGRGVYFAAVGHTFTFEEYLDLKLGRPQSNKAWMRIIEVKEEGEAFRKFVHPKLDHD